MPPKFKFTKEEIIKAALDLTRESGISAVTARGLGAKLGSSSKPIFGLFQNMEEVQKEVLKAANKMYQSYLNNAVLNREYPPYKASGMAYIRFAKEEKELFKLLFMRDRTNEKISENKKEIEPLLEMIQKNIGLSEKDAYIFHIEMWIYVHGIATMMATDYLDWDWDLISSMITDNYEGLKMQFQLKGKNK